jgi:pyridoxine/pyridoxamine 5'-phosphate oxidase
MNASDKPNLQDLRVSYDLDALDESSAPSDPFILFHDWLHDALQHQLPEQVAYYTHRSGRTGRAGKKGLSLSLIEPKEKWKVTQLEKSLHLSFNEYR